MVIITSVYTKNQHLALEVGEVNYNSPIRGKTRATISKFNLSRSNISNV